MNKRNINQKSLDSANMRNFLQFGGVPTEMEPANPNMEELIVMIKGLVEANTPVVEIIKTLVEQSVPVEVAIESLSAAGVSEEHIQMAVQELQSEQQPAQEQMPAEGAMPPEAAMPPQGEMPPQAMSPEMGMGMPPMMQNGGEDSPESRDFTTHFTNTSSSQPVMREQSVYDPATDPNLTKQYMTDRKGNITGQTYVPAGKTYNTRKLNRQFQKGKIDGTPIYDGTYQNGGQSPYGTDTYKDIELIYPDGSIKTQSMNEKMFKSGYIDYKKPVKKSFSDGTSKTQYRYNPEGGFDLPRVNYKDTSSVDLSKKQGGGEMNDEDMMSRNPDAGPPEETLETKGGWEYKRVYDPTYDMTSYYTKKKGASKWQDLQQKGNETARKSVAAEIYGDNKDEWFGTEEQIKVDKKRKADYKTLQAKREAKKKKNEKTPETSIPTIEQIKNGNYKVKVIQYPYGYVSEFARDDDGIISMPPGHIETILIGPDGKPIQKWEDAEGNIHDGFVNRWEMGSEADITRYDKGTDDNVGSETKYGRQFENADELKRNLDQYGVRSVDLELDTEQLTNFLSSAAGESDMDYHFTQSNCADGVCRAIGYDENDKRFDNAGITDPTLVFDQILKDPKLKKSNAKGDRVGQVEGLKRMAKNANINLLSDYSLEKIADYAKTLPAGTAERLMKVAPQIKKNWDKADGFFESLAVANDAYKQLPDGTIPTAIKIAGKEGLDNYVVKPVKKAVKATGEFFEDAGDAIMDGLDYINPFEDGGSTGRYSFMQNGGFMQRQNPGAGNMAANFNQYFSDDPSFRANINSAYQPMDLGNRGNMGNALLTLGEGIGRMFSGEDKDGDGLMDGAFRDNKAKRNRHKAAKAASYNYNIEVDPNDPNEGKYVANAMDLYDASKKKNPGKLKTNTEVGDGNTMLKFNEKTNRYDFLNTDERFMSKNKNLRPDLEGFETFSDLQSRAQNLTDEQKKQLRYVGDQVTDYATQKKSGNLPKGMQFGIDEKGGVGYYDKGSKLPEGSQERLNNMMMINKEYGGSAPKKLRRAQDGFEVLSDAGIINTLVTDEVSGGMTNSGNPDPSVESVKQKLDAARRAYELEQLRVADVNTKIGQLARGYGDRNASGTDVGISQRLQNWMDENGGFTCNTYSCQIMREAGVTIPEGTEPFELNGRTYKGGMKLPIIPGNLQFDSNAEKLGFQLTPAGTYPDQQGDLLRVGHPDGTFHSMLSAGYGDDDRVDIYNNPGQNAAGYVPKYGDRYVSGDEDFYTDDTRVMRYVGDVPRLRQEMEALESQMQKKNGGSFDNPGFKALPPAVQQKIMKAQDGAEIESEIDPSNLGTITESVAGGPQDKYAREMEYHRMKLAELQRAHAMQMQAMQQKRMLDMKKEREQSVMTVPPNLQNGGRVDMSTFIPPMVTDPGMMDAKYNELIDPLSMPSRSRSREEEKALDISNRMLDQYMRDNMRRKQMEQDSIGAVKPPMQMGGVMPPMPADMGMGQDPRYMQLLDQVAQADQGRGSRFRTDEYAAQFKRGGSQPKSVELTTEQIAKIMAAGGSVKIL